MDGRLRVGIIGAGSIAEYHAKAIDSVDSMVISAVSSRNAERAKSLAAPRNVNKVYCRYQELLADPEVDAVVIATPTFTHHDIIMEALKCGKHVFCEKPPALNAGETEECIAAAKAAAKVLMFGMVCRFSPRVMKLKKMADEGVFGDFYYAKAVRTKPVSRLGGWFLNKEKAGGGELFDGCIHEIDQVLYLMDYPKPKYVCAMTSSANADLPDKVKDIKFDWVSAEGIAEKNTVETLAGAMIAFEDGRAMHIVSGRAMFTEKPEQGYRLLGTNGGIAYDGKTTGITTIDENRHMVTNELELPTGVDLFVEEFKHFSDCCLNGTECICSNTQAVELMKILDGIYRSAELNEPVFIK